MGAGEEERRVDRCWHRVGMVRGNTAEVVDEEDVSALDYNRPEDGQSS